MDLGRGLSPGGSAADEKTKTTYTSPFSVLVYRMWRRQGTTSVVPYSVPLDSSSLRLQPLRDNPQGLKPTPKGGLVRHG